MMGISQIFERNPPRKPPEKVRLKVSADPGVHHVRRRKPVLERAHSDRQLSDLEENVARGSGIKNETPAFWEFLNASRQLPDEGRIF